MVDMRFSKCCDETNENNITVKVTTEGTLNIQAFFDAYIRLGLDTIVQKHESEVKNSTSA